MRNSIYVVLLVLFLPFTWADTQNALNLLDQMRTQGDTVKVSTRIEVFEQGILQRQSTMDVYVGTQQRSLAVYRSEREAGQKVLMVDDNFWLFLPSSKRAMRITAMQKMLGEASVGDVASLDWSQDYTIVAQRLVNDQLELALKAARKGLSYAKITLWVRADNNHPLHADLYLKSGKLAKQAEFNLVQADDDSWQMQSLTLHDKVQKDQTTIIYYDQVLPMEMDEKWFTPNFLLRDTPK